MKNLITILIIIVLSMVIYIFLPSSKNLTSIPSENLIEEVKEIYKDGKHIEYNDRGQIIEETNYKDGQKHGKHTYYYDDPPSPKIWGEGNYRWGKKHGRWTRYDRDGRIKFTKDYKNGMLNGKWIQYYDGKIDREVNYKNDKLDGEWINYYGNGKIKSIKYYKDGELYDRQTFGY